MGAHLTHKFKGGFLLTEEALVRIEDILRTRVNNLTQESVTFKIFRSDGLVLEYKAISDFIKDPNMAITVTVY